MKEPDERAKRVATKFRAKPTLVIVWMVIVGAAIITHLQLGIPLKEYPNLLQQHLDKAGVFGPLLYIVFYVIRPLIFFPATVLTALSGIMFGPLYGSIYTLIGENISAALSYMIGKYFGEDFVKKQIKNKKIRHFLDKQLHDNSFLAVLIMRLSFLPFDLVGYFSGAMRIRLRDYVLATFIGVFPGLITFVFLGSAITDPRNLLFSVGALIIGITIGRIIHKRSHKQQSQSSSSSIQRT